METKVITLNDNLEQLVQEINAGSWDDANEMSEYTHEALAAYLERQDTIFIACHDTVNGNPKLVGVASSRIEIKPYDRELWLYVDEVDVCTDHRQKGAGKLIMQRLLEIAKQSGCAELWLGTEIDNHPANALYKSLQPDDVAAVVGYTYETDA